MAAVNIPDIHAIAVTLLGSSELIYKQSLPVPRTIDVDKLQAGEFDFSDGATPAGAQSKHDFKHQGLFIETHRPLDPDPAHSIGFSSTFAGARLPSPPPVDRPLPLNFIVAATFQKIKMAPDETGFVQGNWGATVGVFRQPADGIIKQDDFFGASARVRDNSRVHLNVPGTGAHLTLPDLPEEDFNEIMNENVPFTLAFHVKRSAASSTGHGFFFIRETQVDATPQFTFGNGLTSATPLRSVAVGIATAGGSRFKVSTDILEFEVWGPTS